MKRGWVVINGRLSSVVISKTHYQVDYEVPKLSLIVNGIAGKYREGAVVVQYMDCGGDQEKAYLLECNWWLWQQMWSLWRTLGESEPIKAGGWWRY
jgi:hypothetical protein